MERIGTFCEKCRQPMCICEETKASVTDEMRTFVREQIVFLEDEEQNIMWGEVLEDYYYSGQKSTDEAIKIWKSKFTITRK